MSDEWMVALKDWIFAVHDVVEDGCKGSCGCVEFYRSFARYDEDVDNTWGCRFGGYCVGDLDRHATVDGAESPEELVAAVKKTVIEALERELALANEDLPEVRGTYELAEFEEGIDIVKRALVVAKEGL